MRRLVLIAWVLLCSALLPAQIAPELVAHVHGEMSFLASEAMHGRGSATRDEWIAATYVVSQFESFGMDAVQLQRVPLAGGANTYNAVGILRGRDPALAKQTVLLSAHVDHVGTRYSVSGETIYPGADDDASGTTAVLELARAMAALPRRPQRTTVFVCFGSEETGGQGNEYFLQNPPVPLESIVANLEFEMIGHADAAVRANQLWLTGWERSDLGPVLAQHGAPLVADPHPAQHFFQRSDNFNLARRGIVAQTVSSYGLGPHYHQPGDDLAHIDFNHLAGAIQWMISPVEWLADSDWKPSWNPGGKP